MNSKLQLQSSMWLLVALQTIGAVDPIKGPRKLPAPKVYVAVLVVWSVLGIIADAGQERAAAIMGWVTVLTAMVLGPFGNVAVNVLNTVASKFAINPQSGQVA